MLDNIVKGVLTSILGFAMMCLALYGQFWSNPEWFNDWHEPLIIFSVGFVLLFVREKLADIILTGLKSFVNKITGNKDQQPPSPPAQ